MSTVAPCPRAASTFASGASVGTNTSHGTATYGQIFASGVSAAHRGLLPEGQGITAVYQTGDRYALAGELVDPAGRYKAVFQSNSWGDSLTTSYNSISQQMDRIVFDHDLLICQSQSNAGTRSSRPQAWSWVWLPGGLSGTPTAPRDWRGHRRGGYRLRWPG